MISFRKTLAAVTTVKVAGKAAVRRATCTTACTAALAAAGLFAVPLHGQDTGTMTGTVTDSTMARPLGGAIVSVIGTPLEAITDEEGQFRIEEVPAGHHQVTLFHLRLQVLGASLPLVDVDVAAGGATSLALAIPSRETLLGAWCGMEARSISGVVRDVLTETPVAGVAVFVLRARRRGPPTIIETDALGEFRYCDGPSDEGLDLQAVWNDVTGRRVRVPKGTGPFTQDLYLALTEPVTLQARLVDGLDGTPIVGATVRVLNSQVGGVSDDEGRIRLRGIPAGTIALTTEHVAFAGRTDSIYAESGESVDIELALVEDAIELDPIVVTARSTPELEAVRAGFRYDGMTRAMVDAVIHRTPTFAALLRSANVPGLRIAESGDGQLCVETLRRGGADCAMVEVYLNGVLLLEAGRTLALFDPVSIDHFQFVPPIEARTRFQGGNVGNGVLLLYTR